MISTAFPVNPLQIDRIEGSAHQLHDKQLSGKSGILVLCYPTLANAENDAISHLLPSYSL